MFPVAKHLNGTVSRTMTDARDFSADETTGRERSQTWTPHVNHRPSDPAGVRITSPPTLERDRDRRGSVVSHLSHTDDPTGHMRKRRLHRSETVKTYHEPEKHQWSQPGAEPGIDTNIEDEKIPPHLTSIKARCEISVVDFSEAKFEHQVAVNESLSGVLDRPRPENTTCRWVSVNGLSWDVIRCLGNRYGLHRLAIEDLIHTHSRTKVDWYKDQAFVILTLQKLVRLHTRHDGDYCKECADYEDTESQSSNEGRSWWPGSRGSSRKGMLPKNLDRDGDGVIDDTIKAHSGMSEESPIKDIRTLHRYESSKLPEHTAFMEKHSALMKEDLVVSVEQVAIFLLDDNTIISFFEHSADDVQGPILERLQSEATMLRRSGDASLMLQAIIDAIVDLAIPVRDAYNKVRKELQIDAMTSPDIRTSRALHIYGEEIDMLQNLIKPMVHLVNALRDHQNEPPIPHETQPLPTPPINPPQYDYTASPLQSRDENIPPHLRTQHHKLSPTARLRNGAPLMTRSISDLQRHRSPVRLDKTSVTTVTISPTAHVYFGDVLDHCIVLILGLEQMDASAQNISTLIFNTVGAKTNNFMSILALVTVFFAPLTTVSGYFGEYFLLIPLYLILRKSANKILGMNFADGAGLHHPFAYFFIVAVPFTIGCMVLVVVFMAWDNIVDWFAKRGLDYRRRQRGGVRSRW
nr:hypothetical protein B0A51_16610 [Rachicladosporium sp. CCFEE 5018]